MIGIDRTEALHRDRHIAVLQIEHVHMDVEILHVEWILVKFKAQLEIGGEALKVADAAVRQDVHDPIERPAVAPLVGEGEVWPVVARLGQGLVKIILCILLHVTIAFVGTERQFEILPGQFDGSRSIHDLILLFDRYDLLQPEAGLHFSRQTKQSPG